MATKVIFLIILISLTIYLYAIMPNMFKRNDFAQIMGFDYAHRGVHSSRKKLKENPKKTPENSLKGFKKALEKGYGIELDIQVSKDKKVMIYHDFTLEEGCGLNKKISDLSLSELQQLKLFGTKERIPTLEETLALIDGQVPIIVEIKSKESTKEKCEIISKMLDDYKGIYCIKSFNPYAVYWYRKNRPKVLRGQLATDLIKDESDEKGLIRNFVLSNLLMNFFAKPDFISYKYMYKNKSSFKICKNIFRIPTMAWTIRSLKDYDENKDDFDIMIIDGPLVKKL